MWPLEGGACVADKLARSWEVFIVGRLQARNLTPALSVAGAICDHFRDWQLGTPEGSWVSMGVASDGSYGVPEGLFFSMPVTCRGGQWRIVRVSMRADPVSGLQWDRQEAC